MVLCAVSGSDIKLLEAPPSANKGNDGSFLILLSIIQLLGDKVTFPNFNGEPATPAQMVKKKILENLLPEVIFLLIHLLFFLNIISFNYFHETLSLCNY